MIWNDFTYTIKIKYIEYKTVVLYIYNMVCFVVGLEV